MTLTLSELHTQYPYDRDERVWINRTPLSEATALGDELHLAQDPIDYLATIQERSYAEAADIRKALFLLPPSVVIENYGVDVALWASISSSLQGENDDFNKELEEAHGYDIARLDVARNWEWSDSMRTDTKKVLGQYGLIQSLRAEVLENVDLPAILASSTRDGVELSAKRIDDYAVIPIEADYNWYYHGGAVKGWSEDISETVGYGMWLDTPAGFALTYKGLPNAMAGLAMNKTDEVMLYQMQGVQAVKLDPTKSRYDSERKIGKISSRGLVPIDWQKVLVEVTETIARQSTASSIGIQAAKNNVWIKKFMASDTEPHLPLDQAVKAYDVPAKRLGFRRSATDKRQNWHRPVQAERA